MSKASVDYFWEYRIFEEDIVFRVWSCLFANQLYSVNVSHLYSARPGPALRAIKRNLWTTDATNMSRFLANTDFWCLRVFDDNALLCE